MSQQVSAITLFTYVPEVALCQSDDSHNLSKQMDIVWVKKNENKCTRAAVHINRFTRGEEWKEMWVTFFLSDLVQTCHLVWS